MKIRIPGSKISQMIKKIPEITERMRFPKGPKMIYQTRDQWPGGIYANHADICLSSRRISSYLNGNRTGINLLEVSRTRLFECAQPLPGAQAARADAQSPVSIWALS